MVRRSRFLRADQELDKAQFDRFLDLTHTDVNLLPDALKTRLNQAAPNAGRFYSPVVADWILEGEPAE